MKSIGVVTWTNPMSEETKPAGLYACVKYDQATKDWIESIGKQLRVPNLIPKDDFHTTIQYSRADVPGYEVDGSMGGKVANSGSIYFEKFKKPDQPSCLVMRFDSPVLQLRHDYGRLLGASYDFSQYKPHITLSYDVPDDFYIGDDKFVRDLIIDHEEASPLD